MKIAIICYPSVGGSGVVATQLGRQLAIRGHEVHIISYARPFKIGKEIKGLHFHKFKLEDYPLFPYPFYTTALVGHLSEMLKKYKFDICHGHYAIPHAAALYLAREASGINSKIITTLHGTDVSLLTARKGVSSLLTFALNQSDLVTAVSHSLKEEAKERLSLKNEIKVIPNFVDTELFKPCDKPFPRNLINPGDKVLLHVSNFRPVKCIPHLLKVLDILRKNHPVKLVLVGDGVEKKKIKGLTVQMGLAKNVVFLNSLSNPALLYSKADLFLLPSKSESFGLVALEAMSSGLPVIAYRTGGLPEVVVHGETGFLAEFGDYRKMAQYISQLLNNQDTYKKFSAEARDRAVKMFNQETIIPMYERNYQKLLHV